MGYLKRQGIEAMEPKPHELDRRWIPVEEALPEEGERVLCSDDFDGWIDVLQYERLCGWVDRHGNEPYAKPTHWMPMPVKPPEVK